MIKVFYPHQLSHPALPPTQGFRTASPSAFGVGKKMGE